MTTTCRELLEFLQGYLEGELSPAQTEGFEAHLAVCRPCVAYIENYRKTILLGEACANLDDEGPPADMPEALVQAILASRKLGSRKKGS